MRKVKGVDHDLRWHGDVYKVICALHLLEIPHLEWATLVDLENPKTVLWMTKAEKKEWPQLPSIPSHTLDHYNYESCFKPSLNLLFHPMTQSQALKKILARKS
jgi:hypothetical protein